MLRTNTHDMGRPDMHQEMLEQISCQLNVLTWLSGILLLVLILGPLIVIGFFWRVAKRMSAEFSNKTSSSFYENAKSFQNKGEYDEMIALSRKRKETFPRDAYAWWFEGIGLYQKKEYDAARICLKESLDLDPAFEPSVTPYMNYMDLQTISSDTKD